MRAEVLGGRCSAERCPGDLLSGLHLPAGICGPRPWCCWTVDAGSQDLPAVLNRSCSEQNRK